MYAQDSIDMLIRSGIDFTKHEDHGIDVTHFGELLTSSGALLLPLHPTASVLTRTPSVGLVLVPGVKWISFHSGYDFGYLLKLLTCSPLPSEESVFFDLLHTYFPCIYDIKYMMLSCDNLKGGLQKIAEDLDVSLNGLVMIFWV
jgi:CCR4-NOT transcription complex subunit 7/8